MNAPRTPHSVPCPECGRTIHPGTDVLMGADYWQHLAKEHGLHGLIAVNHIGRRPTGNFCGPGEPGL